MRGTARQTRNDGLCLGIRVNIKPSQNALWNRNRVSPKLAFRVTPCCAEDANPSRCMNKCILVVFLTLVVSCRSSEADDTSAQPRELSELRAKYESDVQNSISPITIQYLDDLKELLKMELNKGDVDAATAVQNEIKRINAGTPYLGTTWRAKNLWGADSTITFKSGGKSIEDWKDNHRIEGQWKLGKDDTEVIVTRADGSVFHFKLDDKGQLERQEYGGTFQQIND